MYSILGISNDASLNEIKKAFRLQSFNQQDNFDVIKRAYEEIMREKSSPSKPLDHNNNRSQNHSQNISQLIGISPAIGTSPTTRGIQHHQSIGDMNTMMSFEHQIEHPLELDHILSSCLTKENINKICDQMTKMFHDEPEERVHIEKTVSLPEYYTSEYLVDIVNDDNLHHIRLSEIEYGEENKFTITTSGKHKIYTVKLTAGEYNNFWINPAGKLCYKIEINLHEALCGFTHMIEHLNGKSYTIKNSNITNPTSIIRLQGLGLKHLNGHGELEIHFKINFPESVNNEDHEDLKRILGH